MESSSRGNLYTIFLLVCLISLAAIPSYGQSESNIDYQQIIHNLTTQAKQGNKKAIRELGSLLNHYELKEQISQNLKSISFFTKEEFDFSQPFDKASFLKFYYDHESELKYSEILQTFYITPLEHQISEYKIRSLPKEKEQDPSILLRRLMENLKYFIEEGNDREVLKQSNKIAQLQTVEGYEFLLEILKKDLLFNSNLKDPDMVSEELCEVLVEFPTKATVQVILNLIKNNQIQARFAAPLLAKITNISVTHDDQFDKVAQRYDFWLDSLKTIGEMRHFGYQQILNFKPSFFQYSVDYYGKALSISDDFPWIRHNALKDILQTQNPRSLFYIAALAWRNKKSKDPENDFQSFVEQLEKLADLKVIILGKTGLSSTHEWKTDENACRNFLIYWASHYQDYEWDDIRTSFMNKEEAIALKENYERLFRRLNSQNDSVAIQSYLMLTEGDPIEVLGLARKYKELLRNYNPALPSFKHQYLEQLVLLTDFCRRNGFRYNAPPRLNELLKKIANARSTNERYLIENQIIKRLALDEITALEYWGCLNENNTELSFSVGRILDLFYSRNWDRIIDNIENLRLYLKKAYLFKNIGVEGICNVYLNKFDNDQESFKNQLKEILKIENDENIIFQIKELLAQLEGDTAESLSDFLGNPDFFMPSDIKKLPPPSETYSKNIVTKIDTSTNKYHQKNWLLYLNDHPSISSAPKLFEWLERNIHPYIITKQIEKIFDHSLKNDPKAWLALWQEDAANYLNWTQQFFEQKLMKLTTEETLSVKDINAVIQSPFFEQRHKNQCLKAINKIKPIRDIRRLRIDGWLSVLEDLDYFDNIELGYKYLDDISKFFDLSKNEEVMVDWMTEKVKNYSVDERGSFFNNLFQQNWFFDFVNDGNITSIIAQQLKSDLQTYLSESDFISEFEEQITVRNITLLENLGKSLEEKIINTLQLSVDENSKLSIEEAILARISFQDLPIVIKYYNELNIVKQYNFLSRDFGLPVFDLQDPMVQDALLSNYKEKRPFDLYAYYLEEFGVDFKTSTGKLDFNKIYKALQYDIVMPFVGSGGKKRDYYTYGLIKLLEMHFQTRLGFHEKLNENQTFYTFNASKRANAWMQYLVKNGWISKPLDSTPSFNVMLPE
ncbi:MAG: hypothetical protein NXI23_03460 [Bacteroidetes bacterium]|jgi:hypothetical protein|nr:hypothetical protein [Bacteroidota bacterium]